MTRTRRLILLALACCVASPALAQEAVNTTAPEPAAAPEAPPLATGSAPGVASTVTVAGRGGAPVRDQRVTVSVPAGEPVMEYVFTARGATVRAARTLHERYTLTEPLAPIAGVPEDKLAVGPIDLVTTWDPKYLPYRAVFRELAVPGDVRRVRRRSAAGLVSAGKFEAPQPDSLSIDRAVRAGDTVTITAPPQAAGAWIVAKVNESGTLELVPGDGGKLPPDATSVAYEVWRQGDFKALFEDEPTFTRVAKDPTSPPGLPLTYVWPDPSSDVSDVFIEKTFSPGARPYELTLTVRVHNFGKRDAKEGFGLRVAGWQHPGMTEGSMFRRPQNIQAASCYTGESLERYEFPSLLGELEDRPSLQFPTATSWVGLDTLYFMSAAAPINVDNGQCELQAFPYGVITSTLWTSSTVPLRAPEFSCSPFWLPPRDGMPTCVQAAEALGGAPEEPLRELKKRWTLLKPQVERDAARLKVIDDAWSALEGSRRGSHRYDFQLFMGPKDTDLLDEMGHDLKEAMDYGMLAFIAEPLHKLLRWFHGLVNDWALAIILLTVLVKLVLLPLTNKSFQNMQKMQKLKPEMDELKAKFGADREAMNKAMMALYKRHSVNPLTGCLPMVMQMPVWLALYQTIGTSVELYHSPMGLWIHDLSAGDPYYVMPVILGLLMLVQSWLTTNTGTSDGLQAKLLKYGMPLMFTVFMLFLPSGLVLYILVNTTLTIVQNLIIRRRMA
jgi:YidC/Oxa1 family membrane protein insertase